MVNTIAISSEMETLYLIDNNRAISFSLTENRGILIGTLNGQITVATAIEPPKMDSDADLDAKASAASRAVAVSGDRQSVKLSVEKTIWTTVYDRRNLKLAFIGATEVEIRRPGSNIAGEEEYKPEIAVFDLDEQVLNIRRIRNTLVIICLPKKGNIPTK